MFVQFIINDKQEKLNIYFSSKDLYNKIFNADDNNDYENSSTVIQLFKDLQDYIKNIQ